MFDTNRFLSDNFGGHPRLIAFVRSFGYEPPNAEAAYKWFRRGAVPGEWFPVLVALLELERGKPLTLVPYLKAGN